ARLPVVSRVAAMLPWHSAQAQIVALTGLVALFYLFKNLFALGTEYFNHKVVGESVVALKSTMIRGYLAMPYQFYLRRNSADLIWNVDTAVNRVCEDGMSPAVAVMSEILAATSIAAVLLYTAPTITLIAGCLLGGGLALLLRFTRAMAYRYGHGEDELSRGTFRDLQQVFGGIKEIKVLGREELFVGALEQKLRGILKLGYLAKTMAASAPLFTEIRAAEPSASNLYDDYLLIAGLERGNADRDEGQAVTFNTAIEFERVSFAYADAEKPVLHEISFTIRPGESIGVVGLTGAGKSTLADLLVGLLRPSTGRILIDGQDLSDRRFAW